MAEPHSPGPGRSTAAAAFDEAKKEIARRNEQAQTAARKARAAREQNQLTLRRVRDRQ